MKTTISVVCYRHKVLANGESPLMLRISKDGKRSMKSLGVSVNPRYWDFTTNQPKRNCPNRTQIQQIIVQVISEYNARILSKEAMNEQFTSNSLIVETNAGAQSQSVEEFYGQLIADLKQQGSIGTAYAYQNSYNVLRKFNRGRELSFAFSQIDVLFLENFERWMRSKNNKDTTLSFQMRTLRAVFNRAVKTKIVSKERNPFVDDYKLSKFNTRTPKRALDKESVHRIMTFDVSQKGCKCRLALDLFIFSYLSGGIAFVDMAYLTRENIVNGRVIYKRRKTHREVNVPLLKEALAIVEKYCDECSDTGYLFPILDARVHLTAQQQKNRIHKVCHQVNTHLRQVAKDVGIFTDLTTYVARHTYATVLKREGVNVALISESLGHSNIQTTQIYLDSFENSQIDEAMKHLL